MRTRQRSDGAASSSNERGSVTGNSNTPRFISTRLPPAVGHPDDAVHLQHNVGNAALTRLIGSRVSVQAKLIVGRSDDPYELEAERIADAVMGSTDDSQAVTKDALGSSVRAMRLGSNSGNGGAAQARATVERALSSASIPMGAEITEDMEARFGQDFSNVRVHTGPTAETATREIGAHAFTAGRDIVVAPRSYSPATREGRRLLAHELTHVVQQAHGRSVGTIQRQSIDPKDYSTFEEWQRNAPAPLSDEAIFSAWDKAHPLQPVLRLPPKTEEEPKAGVTPRPSDPPWWRPQTAGSSLVFTYDTIRRRAYLARIHQAAEAALAEVRAARAAGDLSRAYRVGQEANALRNLLRKESQRLLSPGGQYFSEMLEQPRDYSSVLKKYGERHGGLFSYDTHEEIVKASGRSAKGMTRLTNIGRYAGPAGFALGTGVAAYEIANAPDEHKGTVALRETGGVVGGAVGSTAGTIGSLMAAGAIATALGLSGPPGWAVLGAGLVGGLGGGVVGSEVGRSFPEAWLDLEASRRKQMQEMMDDENYLGGFLLSTPQMGTNW